MVNNWGLVPRAESWIFVRLKKLSRNPLLREGAPLLGLYWVYSLVRWFIAYDSPYEPFANAYRVIRLERQLGIFYEPIIQSRLIESGLGAVNFANWFYTFGYFPVLLLAGVSLYRFDRGRFQTFKLTFLLGLGFALVCYSLFPLAPPRLLPGMGIVDTQRVYGTDLYNHKSLASFYNPYAAMPSLHFGWALLVGIMIFSFERRALKVIGALYPCCMALVIVTTGHHYILDIVGGALVVGLAYKLVGRVSGGQGLSFPTAAAVDGANYHRDHSPAMKCALRFRNTGVWTSNVAYDGPSIRSVPSCQPGTDWRPDASAVFRIDT